MYAVQLEEAGTIQTQREHARAQRSTRTDEPFQAKLDRESKKISQWAGSLLTELTHSLSQFFLNRTPEDFPQHDPGSDSAKLFHRDFDRQTALPSRAEVKNPNSARATLTQPSGSASTDNMKKITAQTERASSIPILVPYPGSLAISSTQSTLPATDGSQVLHLQWLVDRLVEQITLVRDKGKVELSLQLKPDEMGEVTLSIESNKGKLAILFVATGDAQKLLQDNLSSIEAALHGKGFALQSLEVRAGNQEARRDSSSDSRQKNYTFLDDLVVYNSEPIKSGSPNMEISSRAQRYYRAQGIIFERA